MPYNRIETNVFGRRFTTQVREGYKEDLTNSQVRITKGETGDEQIEVITCPSGDPLSPIAETRIHQRNEVNKAKIRGRAQGKLKWVRFKTG